MPDFDLWHLKKVNPQSMVHLTEKPVELAVRAIQYSAVLQRTGESPIPMKPREEQMR
ncbi:MAG: hypothetical protein KF688_11180 [Pirellulales bacterium]|nr:hypothetical protein [Pirellulales bacterium]